MARTALHAFGTGDYGTGLSDGDVGHDPLGAVPGSTGSSSPPSAAFTPAEIANAYDFNQITFSNGTVQGNGAGQTIALIDAYNDPDIEARTTSIATA